MNIYTHIHIHTHTHIYIYIYSAGAISREHLKISIYTTGSNIAVLNTLRPRQNGRHFADDTFKRIFMNENVRISINISLKLVPKGLINNIPALVKIMAWRRSGDKPLSELMLVILPTHLCVARPQWVKSENRLNQMGIQFWRFSWHTIF